VSRDSFAVKQSPGRNSRKFIEAALRSRVVGAGALIAAAVVVAYANTFGVPLLLDDEITVANNPSILDLGNMGRVLSSDVFTTASRPLLNFTFAINHAWTGQRVWSYHAVNLAVHLAAGLALFGIVRRTLLGPSLHERWGTVALPLGALIAAVWALLSQRAESLMGLFYLLTLYFFIRAIAAPRPAFWCAWSVAACFCGMATKEVMVTAPLVVLLYDRAFVSGSLREALARRRGFYLTLGVSWIFLWLLIRGGNLAKQSAGFAVGASWLAYGLTELKAVTVYLKLAIWPHPLVFDYGSDFYFPTFPQWAPFGLIVSALAGATVIAWRRSAALGFAAVAGFVLLSPTSSVVPVVGQPLAENRMYLPLAAVVVLAGVGAYAWGGRKALVGLSITAVALAALTIRRNHDYRDAASIWADTVAKQPGSSRGRNNLANALMKIPERVPDAIFHFKEALRIKPDYADAHDNLANVLMKIPERVPEALAHFQAALRIRPAALTQYNLANLLVAIPGRLPEALTHYEESLRLKPDFAEAHGNLAYVLSEIPGREDEALVHFGEALRLRPDYADAHNNLAILLANTGHIEEATRHVELALKAEPEHRNARINWEKLRSLPK
jgi:protein O-mannosyl-transferase